MLTADGAFSMLNDLGTIRGEEVGETTYGGVVPLSREELGLLYNDEKCFEKVLKAMAGQNEYYYVLFMASYGPMWDVEGSPGYGKDASGPLHVYVRSSRMSDDLWYLWHVTDNVDDPITGSQTYDINSWHTAPSRHWHYQCMRDYSSHPHFKGWALPRGYPPQEPPQVPMPSAPILEAAVPIVMGTVVQATVVYDSEDDDGTGLSCCPFRRLSI